MHELELYHHGILGQKWGVRRFQNKDGTRTAAGKKRYSDRQIAKTSAKVKKEFVKARDDLARSHEGRYITAHNLMADDMNSKHPDGFTDDTEEEYFKEANKILESNYMDLYSLQLEHNEHYKKAHAVIEKYGREVLDDEVRQIADEAEELINRWRS